MSSNHAHDLSLIPYAKYSRLVSENFRVQYGKDGNRIVKKKIKNHQAAIAQDSLDENSLAIHSSLIIRMRNNPIKIHLIIFRWILFPIPQ